MISQNKKPSKRTIFYQIKNFRCLSFQLIFGLFFGLYLVYWKKKRQKNYLWRHLLLVFRALFSLFFLDDEVFELMTCKREELALTILPPELFSLPCLTMFQFLSYRPEFFFILCRLQIEFDQSNVFMYIPVRPGICNL